MFSWTFSTQKEHSASWYIVAVVLVLFLVVYGIVEQLYLMSIVAFLFAGVYLLMENNSTPTLQVQVGEKGIQVGESFYSYVQFSRFTLLHIGEGHTFLRLYPHARISTVIDIPLAQEINPNELRGYLASILEEDKNTTVSNTDALIHAMKL